MKEKCAAVSFEDCCSAAYNRHQPKESTMKRTVIVLMVALVLSALSPFASVHAKPSYCTGALDMCRGECRGTYTDSALMRGGCYVGCTIGYWQCG
jgi:hypothetical protein